jgi:hypothetical protein
MMVMLTASNLPRRLAFGDVEADAVTLGDRGNARFLECAGAEK